MRSDKKIFLVIAALAPGGAERVMSELANVFVNYPKTEVHLVLLSDQKDFYSIDCNIFVHRLGFKGKGWKKLFSELTIFLKLRKLLRKEKPDSVLSFMIKYNVFTLLASWGLGLKVFVSERNNPYRNYGKKLMFLEKLTYKSATGVIAQTNLAKAVLEQRTGNNNVKVIPNPVKNIKLYPEQNRENIILNIGSLHPQKGQTYLIEAFSKLNAPDWKLIIIGEGAERTTLEGLIKLLKLEDRIFMPGVKSNIDSWLAKASVFAFSSIYEGFPNALAEAMSAGLPCVSFDCKTGPRDLIENYKNGILVEEKNVEELANSLQKLIDDPILRLRLGTQAIVIKEHLSSDKIAKCFYEFMMK